MNELQLTGRIKKINIAAWSLAIFVILVGVVMLITTGEKIFLLFVILGALTIVNVIAYDRLVLKPKLAAVRAERLAAEAAATAAIDAETGASENSTTTGSTDNRETTP